MKRPVVKQVEGAEIPVEILAQHIAAVADAMRKITNGPVTMRALHVLIQDAAGGPRRLSLDIIKLVLSSIEQLYVKHAKARRK